MRFHCASRNSRFASRLKRVFVAMLATASCGTFDHATFEEASGAGPATSTATSTSSSVTSTSTSSGGKETCGEPWFTQLPHYLFDLPSEPNEQGHLLVASGIGADHVLRDFDACGNERWSRSMSTSSDLAVTSIFSSEGSWFVAGYFAGTMVFPSPSLSMIGNGYEAFLLRIGLDGDLEWGMTIGGAGDYDGAVGNGVSMVGTSTEEVIFASSTDSPDLTFHAYRFTGGPDPEELTGYVSFHPGGSPPSPYLAAIPTDGDTAGIMVVPAYGSATNFYVVAGDSGEYFIAGDRPSNLKIGGKSVPDSSVFFATLTDLSVVGIHSMGLDVELVSAVPDPKYSLALLLFAGNSLEVLSLCGGSYESAQKIVRVDASSGMEKWSKCVTGNSGGLFDVAIAVGGDVLAAGSIVDTLTIDGTPFFSTDGKRGLVAKWPDSGPMAVMQLGGPGMSELVAIRLTADARFLVGGTYSGTIDIPGIDLSITAPTTTGFAAQLQF
jgi:hypothetical protein